MDASSVKSASPLKRACFVLAASAMMCVFMALTVIEEGQKYVWPFKNSSGSNRWMRPVKTGILGFLHNGLEDVDEDWDFREHVLREQAERQQLLARGCNSAVVLNSTGAYPVTDPSLVVNVPPPLSITYCAIPKCGTTSWLLYLERLTGTMCGRLESHACARAKFSIPSSLKHFLPRSLVIVRDPWRRLVSAYADKFVAERHKLAESCYQRSGKSLNSDIPVTFAEYVNCILSDYRSGRTLDRHVAPQYWQCSLCQANYSFIVKMENLAEEFRYLAKYVFLKPTYEEHQKIFSSSRRRPIELRNTSSIIYEDCYRSLKPADMAALVSLYQPDAEFFGYPLQPLS